jgi:tetratricopeptide (TPR) repeat protein
MSSSFGPSVTSLDPKPPSSSELDDAASPAVLIALRLHLQGASEEALKELEQSEDESPDALLIRGQILFELKQFEEAAASFKRLADEMPKDPIAAFNQGLAWRV